MRSLIIFVFALAITVPTTHGKGRILNGQDAILGQFPYSCGGSLISRNYILTAAHCLENKVNATVNLGAIKRYEAEAYRYVSRSDFIVHDRFNNETMENDIALIRLPTIEFTNNIQLVNLPKLTETNQFENEHVKVAGWGHKGNPETTPSTELLQWTQLTVLSNEDCRRKHSNDPDIKRSNLCANSLQSRTCSGDSGSPVVLESTNEQVAIVSWGNIRGCEAGFPSVFVRVTDFLQWIKANSDVAF